MHRVHAIFTAVASPRWHWLRHSNPTLAGFIQTYLKDSGVAPAQLMSLADQRGMDYLPLAQQVYAKTLMASLSQPGLTTEQTAPLMRRLIGVIEPLRNEISFKNQANKYLEAAKRMVTQNNYENLNDDFLQRISQIETQAKQLHFYKYAKNFYNIKRIIVELNKYYDENQRRILSTYVNGQASSDSMKIFTEEEDVGLIQRILSIYKIPLNGYSAIHEIKTKRINQHTAKIVNPVSKNVFINGKSTSLVMSREQVSAFELLADGYHPAQIQSFIESREVNWVKLTGTGLCDLLEVKGKKTVINAILKAHEIGLVCIKPQRLALYQLIQNIDQERGFDIKIVNNRMMSIEVLRCLQKNMSFNEIKASLNLTNANLHSHIQSWLKKFDLISNYENYEKKIAAISGYMKLKNWIVPDDLEEPGLLDTDKIIAADPNNFMNQQVTSSGAPQILETSYYSEISSKRPNVASKAIHGFIQKNIVIDGVDKTINFSTEQIHIMQCLAEGHDKSAIALVYGKNTLWLTNTMIALSRMIGVKTNDSHIALVVRASELKLIQVSPERLALYRFMLRVCQILPLNINMSHGQSIAFSMLRAFQDGKSADEIQSEFNITYGGLRDHINYWLKHLKIPAATRIKQQMTDIAESLKRRGWVVPPAAHSPQPLERSSAPAQNIQ
jgi:hypothetical protein